MDWGFPAGSNYLLAPGSLQKNVAKHRFDYCVPDIRAALISEFIGAPGVFKPTFKIIFLIVSGYKNVACNRIYGLKKTQVFKPTSYQ